MQDLIKSIAQEWDLYSSCKGHPSKFSCGTKILGSGTRNEVMIQLKPMDVFIKHTQIFFFLNLTCFDTKIVLKFRSENHSFYMNFSKLERIYS